MPAKPAFHAVVLPSVALAAIVCAARAAAPGVIIDETCYLRHYCQFGVNRYSAAAIRAEGESVLGKAGLDRLRRETERALEKKGVAAGSVDWRENVCQPMHDNFSPAPAPPPPADWAAPDFDDSPWVRRRFPFQGGPPADITSPNLGQYDESMDLGLQAAYYRIRFQVDDPAAVGPLALRVVYSGGVRALVNGQEVARANLPAGDLAPGATAEDYPAAAYKAGGERLRDRAIGPVQVPQRLLRKGVNVLAIEVRASMFHPVVLANPRQPNWGGPTRPWPHARLTKLELRGGGPGVRSALLRPAGVQVWAEDVHHRTESTDFLAAGESPGCVRFVAPLSAIASAQVVIGADKPLTGLRVACSEWKHADGAAALPAAVVQALHMVPYPLDEWNLQHMGDERGLGASFPDARKLAAFAAMADPRKVYVFDRLTAAAPKSIPAGTCRPVWLCLRIPATAAPGRYQAAVTVAADGVPAIALPMELEVADWCAPKPRDFQTFVGCEENPYGVAKQYGVKLWSEEHFALLEASFRQLGRAGSRWLNVPVLINTEFGNKDDSMIRWVRGKGGAMTFDFAVLDRYLDLAAKHCGPPRVVNVVVEQGMKSPLTPPTPPQVKVFDQATGRTSLLAVGTGGGGAPEVRDAWRAFAVAMREHMKSRGLKDAVHWGSPLETEAEPDLKNVLAAAAPDVFWVAGPHEMMANGTYAKNDKFYQVITTIRYWGQWPAFRTDQGWKSRATHLLNPRVGGTVFALHTTSNPLAYRVLPGHALAMGRSGFTRVGADEWAAAHFDGMAISKWQTGMPVLFMLWPGDGGAETSARFESLIEGIQEAEARIFIEQALDRGSLPPAVAARARKVLGDDISETKFFEGNSIIHAFEEYHYGWRERAVRLYHAAAEAAKSAGPAR
jgi:hypothetical protein